MKKEVISNYDKEKEFNEKILPLVEEIVLWAQLNRIPAFLSFAVKSEDESTTYISKMVSAVSNDIHLKKDHIVDFANCLNGFKTVIDTSDGDTVSIELPEEFDILECGNRSIGSKGKKKK